MNFIFNYTYSDATGGVFTYAFSTLNALIKNNRIEKKFVVVSLQNKSILEQQIIDDKIQFVILKYHFFQKKLLSISSLLYDVCDLRPKRTRFLWKIACFINPYRYFIDSFNADLLHIPSLVSPGFGMKTPILVTMYDFQELYYPEFFTSSNRRTKAYGFKNSIDESDHIIVSFNHVRNDLLRYFEIKKDKVSICQLFL